MRDHLARIHSIVIKDDTKAKRKRMEEVDEVA
jgi:hypothetical protein